MNADPAIINLLDAKDVKKILKCSLNLVYVLANRGQLPCVRWNAPGIGTIKPRTMLRFQLQDVLSFIEKNRQEGRQS